jgi:hypothetical protein
MSNNKVITSRSIGINHRTEGPRHDPYGFNEYMYEVNGKVFILHAGLAVWLRVGGKNGRDIRAPKRTTNRDKWLMAKFEDITGLSLEQFEKANDRINPYFDDPFGSPRMYM